MARGRSFQRPVKPLYTVYRIPYTLPAFTLIEIIMAVTILAIAITAVFSLILLTINLNTQNLLKVQALELSREALEGVRNVRDTSWKNNQKFISYPTGAGWSDLPGLFTIEPNLDDSRGSPWIMRPIAGPLSDPPIPAQRGLLRLFFYGEPPTAPSTKMAIKAIAHDTPAFPVSQPSPFYRYVKAEAVNVPGLTLPTSEGLKVTVLVYYEFRGQLRKMETVEILTNWRKI